MGGQQQGGGKAQAVGSQGGIWGAPERLCVLPVPSRVRLRRVNAVLWLIRVDSQPSSVSRPLDFGQSSLLSFKTELGDSEGV